jgi:hypothetical protein
MLLSLVVYSWSQQVRSSRRIQRLCQVDVAYRLICAGDGPHHATVSRFVADCRDVVEDLFGQMLAACRRLGLVRLGTVAIDGGKIAANASLLANRTRQGIQKELARLAEAEQARRVAAAVVAEQLAVDAAEDAEFGAGRVGDELPAEVADRRSRRVRLEAALDEVKRRTPPPPPPAAPRPEVVAGRRARGGRTPKGVDGVAEAEAVLARRLAEASSRYETLVPAAPPVPPPGCRSTAGFRTPHTPTSRSYAPRPAWTRRKQPPRGPQPARPASRPPTPKSTSPTPTAGS